MLHHPSENHGAGSPLPDQHLEPPIRVVRAGANVRFLDSSSDGSQVARTTGDFAPSGNLGLQASWRTDEAGRGRPDAALLVPTPGRHQPSDERQPHAVSASGASGQALEGLEVDLLTDPLGQRTPTRPPVGSRGHQGARAPVNVAAVAADSAPSVAAGVPVASVSALVLAGGPTVTVPVLPAVSSHDGSSADPNPPPPNPSANAFIDLWDPVARQWITGPNKDTPGGLLVKEDGFNNAPRAQVRLYGLSCDSVLLSGTGLSRVEVFTTDTGTVPLSFNGTDNLFPAWRWPVSLWVEGVQPSGTMRDVKLRAMPWDVAQNVPRRGDAVKFTVLWVSFLNVNFSGPVNANNTARAFYMQYTDNHTSNLGLQTFHRKGGDALGWGFEVSGFVSPSDFNYPGAQLRLNRDAHWRPYEGKEPLAGFKEVDFSDLIPPGNDPSRDQMRDDNPVASQGMIFDLDVPRLNKAVRPQNTIQRWRGDFKEFAQVMTQGQLVLASGILPFYVRFSMIQKTAPQGTNWVMLDPPDVPGDNQADNWYGVPPPITWNLL